MAEGTIKEKIRAGLHDESARVGRDRALGVIKPAMKKMTASYPDLRSRLTAVKKYSIDHLQQLLPQTVKVLRDRGWQVLVADTPQEALDYIGKIVGKGLVVKSKTNAGKEINVPHYLEDQGAKVVETDLGDRINQLDGGVPSHSLAPAIHVPIERVAELFSKEVGEKLEPELEALVTAARKSLRKYLEQADVGISGANAVIAETGAIIVTENEGNIRAVTSIPRIHIAIAGVEKIVPKLLDGIAVVKAAAAYGVGQDIGTYVSVISGPSRFENDDFAFLGAAQGPQELHMVFLKPGREKAIADDYKETLYCINCGSCLNFCPVYSAIGEKYGYKYLGGRGTVFTAMHASLEKAEEAGLSLCIGCKRCEEACAVEMQTPGMIARLRATAVSEKGLPWARKTMFKMLAANKLPRYARLAEPLQGIATKASGEGTAKPRMSLFDGLPTDRLVPLLAPEHFSDLVKKRKPATVARKGHKVGFFAGCLVNFFRPDLGGSLLDVLEREGVEVITFPDEACCGIPALTSGDESDARKMAAVNVEMLSQQTLDQLIFLCPTCASTAKREWPRLLSQDSRLAQAANTLAAKVMDISEYLVKVVKISPPQGKVNCKVTYHDPCHLVRDLKIKDEPRQLINSIPGVEMVEMKEPDSCCGFGGSFSLFYYDLSRKINDDKVKQIMETGADYVVTGCPGCMVHLADGISHENGRQKPMHVIELLAKAYNQDGGENQ